MSKYINADELISALNETIEKHKNSDSFTRTVRAAENMITIIKRMPSADVVEVVRCKDCIYHGKRNDKECCTRLEVAFPIMYGDDFCSYGERKETK